MRLLTWLVVALFALQCINTEVVYGGDTLPTPNVLERKKYKVELKHIEKRSLGPYRFPFGRPIRFPGNRVGRAVFISNKSFVQRRDAYFSRGIELTEIPPSLDTRSFPERDAKNAWHDKRLISPGLSLGISVK
ncbi:hypothetical protein JTE90_012243 [Oedothorax gibbosus]|uniref:Uncharacterized protein n=1 Tax=Oedothorax gibbosus TaxID=931172 RepID=A0AAV6UWM0_9ARAC|nr:hypothetical protein JTE90_012243 [Oedothorax gibbosus]